MMVTAHSLPSSRSASYRLGIMLRSTYIRRACCLAVCMAVTTVPMLWQATSNISSSSTFPLSAPFWEQRRSTQQQRRQQQQELSSKYDTSSSMMDTPVEVGILSQQPKNYFARLQDEIDSRDPVQRCHRYGWTYQPTDQKDTPQRRIFYGALIADEPWELLEIIAAETRGIFSGMVLVESNRTQTFAPREIKRANRADPTAFNKNEWLLHDMFQVPLDKIQLRNHVNENPGLSGLLRENQQRQEILKGWKELGMGPDDIGYIADLDESFSRDALRAILTCEDIPLVNVEQHKCGGPHAKLRATTLVFETTPECATQGRSWYHPDMVMGACLEEIASQGVSAPRREDQYRRVEGYGPQCNYSSVQDDQFPLLDAADFRCLTCSTPMESISGSPYTGYHFHNFFANVTETLRFKYQSYGHARKDAMTKPLHKLQPDLDLMVRCVKKLPEEDGSSAFGRVMGGFATLQQGGGDLPLYFADAGYRQARHKHIELELQADQRRTKALAQSRLLRLESQIKDHEERILQMRHHKDIHPKTSPEYKQLVQDSKQTRRKYQEALAAIQDYDY